VRKKKDSADTKPVEINVEEEFPHSGFPYKLVHKDGKDGIETRTCYFMNQHHMDKHIERYKLDKRTIKVLCRHDYETPKK
jgi:hypothetical protein